MAATIQHKRGSGAPTAGDLSQGELALDLTNYSIYSKDTSDAVVQLSRNPAFEMVSVKDYGAKGNGSTDDSDAIQAALDANTAVFFPAGTYIVEKPIYMTRNTIQGEGVDTVIRKSGTTVGTGSNVMRSSTVTDSYAVDAVVIVTHTDNDFSYYNAIYDITIQGDTSYTTEYALYAPRMSQSVFKNVRFSKCRIGFFTHDSWQCLFERVTSDPERSAAPLTTYNGDSSYGPSTTAYCFRFDADTSGGTTGTSCTFVNCWARRGDYGFFFENLYYSSMINCAADQINITPYRFTNSYFTLTGCGSEGSMGDPILQFSAGRYTIINFTAFNIYGKDSDSCVYKADSGSQVSFIDSKVDNYNVVNSALLRIITDSSSVKEYFTTLPSNLSTYVNPAAVFTLVRHTNAGITYQTSSTNTEELKRIPSNYYLDDNKQNISVASAGTNVMTVTVSGSGTSDYVGGKLKIYYRDLTFANGVGYLETAFTCYREGANYYQDVTNGDGSLCGNTFTTQPTYSFTRSGNTWTLKLTPAHGDLVVTHMMVEGYTDDEGDATLTIL